ncbi:MAG: hypothetical protein PHQ23_01315 [Candidatus Wallbacteria bacterium]|nr:hypothetical protein [Candidatus Wallbacteria bacterium]
MKWRIFFITVCMLLVSGCGGGGGGGGGTLTQPVSGEDLTPPLAVKSIRALPWSSMEVHIYMDLHSDQRLYGVKLMRKAGSAPVSHDDGSALIVQDFNPGAGRHLIIDGSGSAGTRYYYSAFTYTQAGIYNTTQPNADVLCQSYSPQPYYGIVQCLSGGSDTGPGNLLYAVDPTGILCGIQTVAADTGLGNFSLKCYHDDPDTAGLDEGGTAGENIAIYVDGHKSSTVPQAVFGAKGVIGVPAWTQEVLLQLTD